MNAAHERKNNRAGLGLLASGFRRSALGSRGVIPARPLAQRLSTPRIRLASFEMAD